MQNCTLLTPSRYPSSDVAQILDCDTPASAFSFGNDLLCYYVIGIGRETLLTAAEFPEFTTASPSSLGLQLTTKSAVPKADAFDGFAAITPAIRISSDLSDSDVNAEPLIDFFEGGFFYVAGDGQIPLISVVDEIGFALAFL